MTEGERIARDLVDRPIPLLTEEGAAIVARRIDAALAEVARERDQWREDARIRELNTRDAEKALAEREAQIARAEAALTRGSDAAYWMQRAGQAEAQIAAMREALRAVGDTRQFGDCWCSTINRTYCVGQPACKKAKEAVASTADAAARCLARARQEGAEEMRERAAQRAEFEFAATAVAAAIRALDAGDSAARRG